MLLALRDIDLNRGMPPAEAIPSLELGRIAARLATSRDDLFQYAPIGGFQGDKALRNALAEVHGEDDPDNIFVGNGSLQLLDLLAASLLEDAPSRVIVEAPTYDRAISIFRRYGAQIEAADIGADGIDTEQVEALVREGRPAFIYLIPDFQNPSGTTLSFERRRHLAEIATRFGVTIVEDIPYRELRYWGASPPTLRTIAGPEHVITLASLSKTLSPGLRIGYALCDPERAGMLAQRAENTYLSPAPLCQAVAAEALCSGLVRGNIRAVRELIGPRCKQATRSAAELFGDALIARPQGGYFLSLSFNPAVDETELLLKAAKSGLRLARGSAFLPTRASTLETTFVRLPFQALQPPRIAEAFERLAAMLREMVRY